MNIRRIVRDMAPYGLLRAYWKTRGAPTDEPRPGTLLARHMDSYNVVAVAEFLAALDSARFYERELLHCAIADSDLRLLELSVSWRRIEGMVVEFGVATGRTINHLSQLMPDANVFGFDWFRGLPEEWRTGFPMGTFRQPVPIVGRNVTLVNGLFEETLPSFLTEHKEVISLLHVDCDLYSSTKTIFDHLASRLVPGSIIVFDEYVNYPGWRQHEFRAFREFVRDSGRQFEYLGFVPRHQQVCVRITE